MVAAALPMLTADVAEAKLGVAAMKMPAKAMERALEKLAICCMLVFPVRWMMRQIKQMNVRELGTGGDDLVAIPRQICGGVIALFVAFFVLFSPAVAQDLPPPVRESSAPWQAVIDGQVEAFRAGNDGAALSFAAGSFQAAYADPADFVAAIRGGGYGPILDSRSHIYGDFRFNGTDRVVQAVTFFAPGQRAFEAVYQLGLEPSGWRIEMVILKTADGVGV
jgi:uncharacterized protein DUF4864